MLYNYLPVNRITGHVFCGMGGGLCSMTLGVSQGIAYGYANGSQ
jgi:hypothetical protein